MAAIEATHASQLAALREKLAAEEKAREEAIARLKKEQEAERERVKRAIAELKKKLDRCTTLAGLSRESWQYCCIVEVHATVYSGGPASILH